MRPSSSGRAYSPRTSRTGAGGVPLNLSSGTDGFDARLTQTMKYLLALACLLSVSCVATSADLARIEAQVNAALADGVVTPEELSAVHAEVGAVKDTIETRAAEIAATAAKTPSVLGLPGGGLTDLAISIAASVFAIRQRHKLGLSGPPPKREES